MPSNDSLTNQVIKKVKKDIQVNNIAPDQIITENQLCNELNISRTPVREALIHLTSDGILKKVPRKGYAVQKIDTKTKLDTYTLFSTLESLAATLAVDHLTEDDLMKMREYIDRINIALKYKNCSDYYFLNDKFHNVYINKCDNEPLIKMIRELEASPINRSYVGSCSERLLSAFSECNDDHHLLVELFEKKDIAGINEFHRKHWETKHVDMI
ncbi:GntR family transcriptional regulator [Clostridia bacterium]|nr:GntR family transcriptional regulator [Clostridia bacterium]